MSEENVQVAEEWDLNDPILAEYRPEINIEEIPKQLRMAPPPDGFHWVKARLGNRKDGPPVYLKGERGPNNQLLNPRVVATVECKIYDRETGLEGSFLNTWWPTSTVMKGSTGSQLTALHFLGKGEPIKSSINGQAPSLKDIIDSTETLFVEAGEDGVLLLVQTKWTIRIPKLDENGMYIYKGEYKDTNTIRGEDKIKKMAARKGIPKDQAHIWPDPGDETSKIYVYAEVVSLEDPSNFEEV